MWPRLNCLNGGKCMSKRDSVDVLVPAAGSGALKINTLTFNLS